MVVADLDGAQAARVAADIGGTGVGIDVRHEAAIVALVENTEASHGPIDLFVSNAGFVTTGGVEDTNERIQNMWEVHVLAHIRIHTVLSPDMPMMRWSIAAPNSRRRS